MKTCTTCAYKEVCGVCAAVCCTETGRFDGVPESNGLFALNELGAFLWKHLPRAQNEEELITLILNEYDVDRETASADTTEFLQELREMEILE